MRLLAIGAFVATLFVPLSTEAVAPGTPSQQVKQRDPWKPWRGKGPIAPGPLRKLDAYLQSPSGTNGRLGPPVGPPVAPGSFIIPPEVLQRLRDTVAAAEEDLVIAAAGAIDGEIPTAEHREMKAGKAIAYSFRSQDAKDRGLSRRKDLVALARRVDDRVVALTTPTKQVPHLDASELKTGQVGAVEWTVTVESVLGPNAAIVRVQYGYIDVSRRFPIDHRGFTPVLLRGYATTDLADEKRFTLRGNFRVSGTEKIGERTLFVLELRKQG